jgi:glycosyltransferase involved in cell wall biosynthesis
MLNRVAALIRRIVPRRSLLALKGVYIAFRNARRGGSRPESRITTEWNRHVMLSDRRNPFTPRREITKHRFGKVAGASKKISVIYNYFKKDSTLFQSLDSIEKQSWKLCDRSDVEILLIDDGTPGEPVADRLPEDVIYVWQRKIGYGICRAKNTGARLANGKYLVFLDPDIMLHPDYFDAMLRGFQEFGERAVQCSYIWDYHFVGCPDPRLEFGVWEHPNRMTRRFYQVAGGNVAIARALFFETPGFDEDLIYGGVEDLLFGFHLGKLPDTAIVFNDHMQSRHIPHPPSGAHANPRKSWEVVQLKWPEFYEDYIVKGLR